MALILMCKEYPIYNIDTEEVLNHYILPRIMKKIIALITLIYLQSIGIKVKQIVIVNISDVVQ